MATSTVDPIVSADEAASTAVPSIPDIGINTQPLQKSSDSYANLTRKGNVEQPSQASTANQAADTQVIVDAGKHVQQAYNYYVQAAGSLERKVVTEGMVYPSDLLMLHGFLKDFGNLDFGIQPETLKALDIKEPSTEMTYKAGQVAGIVALTYGSFAAASAMGVGDVMASSLVKYPAMARYLAPAAVWGTAGSLSGTFQEGVQQVKDGKLDLERFGKVILENGAMGAVGGAIMEGLPANTLSKGIIRAAGASAYGYGSALIEGKSQLEAVVNGGIMGAVAAFSTDQVTRSQQEGVYHGAVKRVEETAKAGATPEKGYSPMEAEQVGKAAASAFDQIVVANGGIDKINISEYESLSKEAWAKVSEAVKAKPVEGASRPGTLELTQEQRAAVPQPGEPAPIAPTGGTIAPVEPGTPWGIKEPWKMTQSEFIDQAKTRLGKSLESLPTDIASQFDQKAAMVHSDLVRKAVASGLPVHPENQAGPPIMLPDTSVVRRYRGLGIPDTQTIKEVFTDELTGVWDQKFSKTAKQIDGTPLKETPSIVFDIDNFKQINDTYGHPVGDMVLSHLGDLAKSHGFNIARTGGEEFQIYLLNNENPIDVAKQFKLFQEDLRNSSIVDPQTKKPILSGVTVSGGFGVNWKKADAAAYLAKKAGKDNLVLDKNGIDEYNSLKGTTYELKGQTLSDVEQGRTGTDVSGQIPSSPGTPLPGQSSSEVQPRQPQQKPALNYPVGSALSDLIRPKPTGIMDAFKFTKKMGGINPQKAGDLRELGKSVNHLFNKNTKQGIDTIQEYLIEAGYLPEGASESDVLDLYRKQLSEGKQYPVADMEESMAAQPVDTLSMEQIDRAKSELDAIAVEKGKLNRPERNLLRDLIEHKARLIEQSESQRYADEVTPVQPKSEPVKLGGKVQDQFLIPGTPDHVMPTGASGAPPGVPQIENRNLLDEFKPDNQPDFPKGQMEGGVTLSNLPSKFPKSSQLPKEISGAKPRYGYGSKLFELNFESDLDKAKYIIAQEKPSKKDAMFLKFVMDATNMTEEQARQSGREVRARIKAMAKVSSDPILTIKDQGSSGSNWSSQAGAVVNPIDAANIVASHMLNDQGTGVAQRINDYVTIDPVPKLSRQGVSDAAVEHASAKIAVPHIVNDLLSQVFPETYSDPKAMAPTIEVLNKDNILGGYDSLIERANQALDAGDFQGHARAMTAANMVAEAHDLKAYDKVVQDALKNPEIAGNIERWKKTVNPELDTLFNEVKAVDPNTPREGRGRHTDARINLVTKSEEEKIALFNKDSTQPIPSAGVSNYRNPNVKRDPFDRAADFTGDYSTDAKTVLTAVLGQRWNEVTKIRFYNDLAKKGVAVIVKPGDKPPALIQGQEVARLAIKFPKTNSEGHTIEAEMNLFIRKDLVGEVRNALDTDMKFGQNPVFKFLTAVQLAQISDAITHSKNLLSAVTRAQGAGSVWKDIIRKMPILGSIDSVVRIQHVAHEVMSDSPEIRAEIAGMAKQGLIRAQFEPTGINLLTHGSQFIHKFDTATRIILNRFYTNLVERGLKVDSLEARRAFINEVGQYNGRLMGSFMKAFRDMGISPFIVAGRNFNRFGRRMITGDPGIGSSSAAASAQMRLTNLFGTLMLFVLPMILNYLITGKVGGRSGTNLGEVDLGMAKDVNGKHKVLDILQISGLRRGMRSVGLESAIEGARSGQSLNEISGKAVDGMLQTAVHPWLGPALGFVSKVAFGRQLDIRGRMSAQKITSGGGMQYVENFRAALESQNPLVYSMTIPAFQKLGIDMTPRDSYMTEIGKTFLKSPAGAFGIKDEASNAGKVIAQIWASKEVPRSTSEEVAARKAAQDISNSHDFDNALLKAVNEGKLGEAQALKLYKEHDLSYVQKNVKHFTFDEAVRVAEVATPKEKAALEEIISKKFMNKIKTVQSEAEAARMESEMSHLYPSGK